MKLKLTDKGPHSTVPTHPQLLLTSVGVLDTEKEQEQDIDLFLVFERILLSVHFKAAKKDPKVPAALHSVLTMVGPSIGPERLHTFLSQFSFRGGVEVLEKWLDKKQEKWGWKWLLSSHGSLSLICSYHTFTF